MHRHTWGQCRSCSFWILHMAINVGRASKRTKKKRNSFPFFCRCFVEVAFVCIGISHFGNVLCAYETSSTSIAHVNTEHNVNGYRTKSKHFFFLFVLLLLFVWCLTGKSKCTNTIKTRLNRKNGLVSRAVFSAAFYAPRSVQQRQKKNWQYFLCAHSGLFFVCSFVRLYHYSIFCFIFKFHSSFARTFFVFFFLLRSCTTCFH